MDYNEIFKQVEEVIRYSQDFPDDMPCNLSNLRNYWGTGKAPWIELFDKHLIYEYPEPVSFSVSNEAKLQMFNGFINMPIFDDYPDLQNFIEDIRSTEFFNNHLEANYEFYDADECEYIIIPKGMKITKAFKYFHLTPDDLKDLQSVASRLIQQDCIKGTLCLSVHPLDYLSMSENVSNWRSCHSLDGVYRNGCLSYMADCNTILCYLRSDDLVKLPNFPPDILWNNKKWRMVLHFDGYQDICFTGRQYPFESDCALDYIQKMLNELFFYKKNRYWGPFSDDAITKTKSGKNTLNNLIFLGSSAKSLRNIISQDMWSYAYPDVLFSDKYTPKWSYKLPVPYSRTNFEEVKDYYDSDSYIIGTFHDDISIIIGYEVKCPCCNINRVMDSDIMLCHDCYQKYQPREYKKHTKWE